MPKIITEEQKNTAIEAYAEKGTMKEAAKAADLCVKTLEREMKRSPKFNEAMLEARRLGKESIGDRAVANIRDCAFGEKELTRTELTANITLANAYVEGFRQKVDHKVEGNIKIITGIPRPKETSENNAGQ